jgi:hypothetical protein
MAAFFLLLTVLVGVVLGDALVENDGAGVLTVFGQTTGRFNQGQLLLVFAGLGFLFALLLGLSLASTRRRRTRRKERRSGPRELGERITELERDNARLRDDLTQRDDALAGREAELAHRDRQLALKDEELARREQELQRAPTRDPAEVPNRITPGATEVLDQAATAAPAAGMDQTTPTPTEVLDRDGAAPAETADMAAAPQTGGLGRTLEAGAIAPDPVLSPEGTEPVAPLHDEPPWLAGAADDQEPTVVSGAGEEPTKPVEGADRPPDDEPARRTEKPDQNS